MSATPAASAFSVVEFPGPEGSTLSGRLFEAGDVGIVLSHMGRGRDSQADWAATAALLAHNGYTVLTYNRGGVCDPEGGNCSEGDDSDLRDTWLEVVSAVDYLRKQGVARVFAGGASIGAMASLRAAQLEGNEIAGVIWFAGVLNGNGYGFREADVSAVSCPLLAMTTTRDGFGAPRAAQSVHDWASGPKGLLELDGNLHGTDVINVGAEEDGAAVHAAILDFLEAHGTSTSHC